MNTQQSEFWRQYIQREQRQQQLWTRNHVVLTDSTPMSPRSPTVPVDKNILNETGTKNYLKLRTTVDPQLKYTYSPTSSCVYGWGLGKSTDQSPPSPHARRQICKHSFFSTGPICTL
ncbi:hypothetical protein GEMRC1_012167 [Eukaryota sp. GEM-RC1]